MDSPAKPSNSKLKQTITGPLLYLFILGDVLGAGVYALVGKVAGEVGGAIWIPLVQRRAVDDDHGQPAGLWNGRTISAAASAGPRAPPKAHPVGRDVVTTLAAVALTTTGDLGSLAETVVLLQLFVFISTNAAVLVLRRDKVGHKHFRGPVIVPYLALASWVVLLLQQGADIWLRAVILLVIGLAFFFLSRMTKPKNRPDHLPALPSSPPGKEPLGL